MARTSLARLTARSRGDREPASGRAPAREPGLHRLDLGGRRDGVLVIPDDGTNGGPLPLLVALHGAGGTGRQLADLLAPVAASRGVAVLAPDSRGRARGGVFGGYGPHGALLREGPAAPFATGPPAPHPRRGRR